MHHSIDVTRNNFDKIKSGSLTFLVVHNLGLDIQTGEFVDLVNGTLSTRAVVKHTTNLHLQVNCLAFGFELVPEKSSDSEQFANAYTSPASRAETEYRMRTPKHILERCCSHEDLELKVFTKDRLEDLKASENKKPSFSNRKKIKECKDSLQQVEDRFVQFVKSRGEK